MPRGAHPLLNALTAFALEKVLAVKWDDEIVKATVLTRDGAIVHPSFAPKSAA